MHHVQAAGLAGFAALLLMAPLCAGAGGDAVDKALDLEALAIVCPERSVLPVIDGAISDAAWKTAAAIRTEYELGGPQPVPHPKPSTFLLCYSRNDLYIAGQITEAEGWKPPASQPARDSKDLFNDCVEVFLAPDFDLSRYWQFVIASSGGSGDLRYGPDVAGRENEWNPEWRLAVKPGKGGWSFEAAIPFAALGQKSAPPPGHVWRLKIARHDPALGLYHFPWSPVRDNHSQAHYAPLIFKTRDLIENGSFKQPGPAGKPPLGWVFSTAPQGENPPLGSLAVVRDDGFPAVRVTTQVSNPRGLGPVLQSAPVQLQAGSDYELSFRVKGSGLRLLARYNTHLGKTYSDAAITSAYEPRVVRFHCEDARETTFRFCHAPAVAGAWFDITDIRLLRQLRAAPSQTPMGRAHPIHRLLALAERNTWNPPMDELKAGAEALPQSVIYRDTATGARVYRLLGPPYWARHVYSSMPPWNGDGSLACVSSAQVDGKNLWLLDMRTWRMRRSPIYAGSRVWHPSEPRLLLVSGKTIKSLDTTTGKVSDFVTVPNAPCALWYGSADRKKLLGWENWHEGKAPRCRLWLFDMTGGEHASVEAPYWIHGAWLTKGADYACTFGVDEPVELRGKALFDVDWKNRRVTRVTDERTEIPLGSHMAFSPSGRYQCGSAFMVMDLATRKVWRVPGTDALNANHTSWDVEDAWFTASGPMGNFRAGVFGRNYAQRINVANSALRGGDYNSEEHCVSSPDGTKLCFATNMLGNNESHWAVMRLPEPPRQLRAARGAGGVRLTWQAPAHAREVAGYAVYRSSRSGEGYTQVAGLVKGLEAVDATLPTSESAAYVVCSVEPSGLASLPSNEAVVAAEGVAWKGRRWVFAEAEDGVFSPSVTESFDAAGASGLL
ncbi:MAG TPA: sugar-binding protein, partial [Candidatus Brocadiia bacterium]|nr:sugar-binding protein [Candidatus Brocadiia bacterium]